MRSPFKLKRPDTEFGFDGRATGLFLYPDVSATPPEVGPQLRQEIMARLTDAESVGVWNHDCLFHLKYALEKDQPIERLLMGFGTVVDNIEELTSDLHEDNPYSPLNARSPINPVYPTMVRFGWHSPWVFRDLARTLSTATADVAGHEGELSLIAYHTLNDEFSGTFTKCDKLTRSGVQNYLLDRSGRRDWLERKFEAPSSRKTITPLLHSSDLRSEAATSLHLIAIDDETRQNIEEGQFHSISVSELEGVGDYIAGSALADLTSQMFKVIPDPAYISYKSQSSRVLLQMLRQRLNGSEDYDIYLENFYSSGSGIDPKDIVDYKGDLAGLKTLVDRYASEHPGEPIADIAFTAFARHHQKLPAASGPIPLPSQAPEIYQGLRGPETPPAFVQRVYGEWLGHGLTRAHVRKLDSKLYDAINNWLSRPGNEWPADVDLPTLKELNDRWADRVQKEGFAPALSEGESGFALREIDRLRGVIQRRQEKQ